MRNVSCQLATAVVGVVAIALVSTARAETVITQPPDNAGFNVMAGKEIVPYGFPKPYTADLFQAVDFQPTRGAPLMDIQVWGEFMAAWVGNLDLSWGLRVSCSIYSNVPADQNPQGYAMPGRKLWSAFMMGPPWGEIDGSSPAADFYNPQADMVLDVTTDSGPAEICQCYAGPPDAFYPTAGETYWLVMHEAYDFNGDRVSDVSDDGILGMRFPGVNPSFGWRSSTVSLGGPAMWLPGTWYYDLPSTPPDNQVWQKLVYPAGHPLAGQAMDLSFSLGFAHDGDANGDDRVDVGDLGILGANYGQSGKTWATADFNGDGVVDVGDLGILGINYGWDAAGGMVPEPATLSLLGLGMLGLIRRR